jgi:hypothetical protein
MIAGLKSVFSLPICPVTEETALQAVHISLWTRLATGKEEVINVAAG